MIKNDRLLRPLGSGYQDALRERSLLKNAKALFSGFCLQ